MPRMCGLRFGALQVFLAVGCTLLLVGARITDPSEVDALRAIKEKLNDPQKFLRNWNKGDPCTRNWTGLTCFDGMLSDGYLHIRELLLLHMNLSGTLAPELGQLSYIKILDFMWNNISGNVPKEIGSIKSLELLLLSGNQLAGSLPDELGFLPNLNRIQIDSNHISGSLPKSFANLNSMKHIHLNNNSISGHIPAELSRLPHVLHILLDNNNLSGQLPPEFSQLPKLLILQLDNNKFDGSEIPTSYSNISTLVKLSLRNCGLRGPVPDLSQIPELGYLDLSRNQLSGLIPSNKLSANITTIDLSSNNLTGPIPVSFSGLPLLQRLSLQNNMLSGSVPSVIWHGANINGVEKLTLNFQNNLLLNFSGRPNPPANVTIMLQGNPLCTNLYNFSTSEFCRHQEEVDPPGSTNTIAGCPLQGCPIEENFDYAPDPPVQCFCAAPIKIGYRLKSPGISAFPPYEMPFRAFLSRGLGFDLYQLKIDSYVWEEGPRLRMQLKLFPRVNISGASLRLFNDSEVKRIRGLFSGWRLPDNHVFGPFELLNFTLLPPYITVLSEHEKLGISSGAVAGIVLGSIFGSITVSSIITIVFMRKCRKNRSISGKRLLSNSSIKVDGVRSFTFGELALATNRFINSSQIGQGGYGKVYKGFLSDGTAVAIKRAQGGSLQGEKEFLTEIQLLSRVHHRNLVSLLGFCDERGEQMLVYEFMPNGTLRDQLSAQLNEALNFPMRLQIACGSAKGILYLHTEANPPIFHRDIKASNILLDSKFTAKVADFGLSRLAPVADAEGAVPGHVSTIVKGTPGYLDPEYFLTHKLTDKSDVYSLGIVFLELLTGMQPISHGKNIVREVNMAYQSGLMFSIIDSRMGSYPSECIRPFLTLALRCCRDEQDDRPSMAEIVRELESIWCMMPESDKTLFHSMTTNSGNVSCLSAAPSVTPNSMGSEVSRNDLVSSVVPVIRPR